MKCKIAGIGAWGPGFNNWHELQSLINSRDGLEEKAVTPKPEIIPANERRRSPLPVKIAVETSWQATQHANISPTELACVFGSGLGDTEITDYMCRVLTTELKQLSPTKFHNSVHNAAAGYWTISTACMQSANSIAAYHETVGLAFLEAITQCIHEQQPVLITLFDTKAHNVYREIFDCDLPFAAAVVITPTEYPCENTIATIEANIGEGPTHNATLKNHALNALCQQNPSAKVLPLLECLTRVDEPSESATIAFAISAASHLQLKLNKGL